jgi:glycosyltransferase involved in cell wall biosynthesis
MKVAPELVVFYSAYTFRFLKEQGLEVFVTSRDVSESFEKVLTINPIASLQYQGDMRREFVRPSVYLLDDRNEILEGTVSRFSFLRRLPRLNFILSQASCLITILTRYDLSKVKLIRAEDPRFSGLWGVIFSKLLRKPLVIGVWGNPSRIRAAMQKPIMPRLFQNPKQEERFEKFILSKSRLVLAQNEENLSYVKSMGVPENRLRLAPLGIGIDKAHYEDKNTRIDVSLDLLEIGVSREKIIVCISRLEEVKNVDHAIRSLFFAELGDIRYKLLIIGQGSQLEKLRDLATCLGIADKVFFLGSRSQLWIAGLLARADIAIAPLSGRALLEIGLAGCPVVAYDVDWHSEIVLTNKTGILVPNLDTKALGLAIACLLKDDSLRQTMSKNIHYLAHQLASPEKQAADQKSMYQELI